MYFTREAMQPVRDPAAVHMLFCAIYIIYVDFCGITGLNKLPGHENMFLI